RAVLGQALDGGDLAAGRDGGNRPHAAARGHPIDVHRAGAASRDAATVFGARQAQLLTQHHSRGVSSSASKFNTVPLTFNCATSAPHCWEERRTARCYSCSCKSACHTNTGCMVGDLPTPLGRVATGLSPGPAGLLLDVPPPHAPATSGTLA